MSHMQTIIQIRVQWPRPKILIPQLISIISWPLSFFELIRTYNSEHFFLTILELWLCTSVCVSDAKIDYPFKFTVSFELFFFSFEILFARKYFKRCRICFAKKVEIKYKRTNSCFRHRKSNIFHFVRLNFICIRILFFGYRKWKYKIWNFAQNYKLIHTSFFQK